MAVVKIIELVGSSKTSTDDAAKQALSQAQGTLRNIRAVDIVSTGIRGENLDEYRAHVRVAFLIEGTEIDLPQGRRSLHSGSFRQAPHVGGRRTHGHNRICRRARGMPPVIEEEVATLQTWPYGRPPPRERCRKRLRQRSFTVVCWGVAKR